jgi:hypothetical protein
LKFIVVVGFFHVVGGLGFTKDRDGIVKDELFSEARRKKNNN